MSPVVRNGKLYVAARFDSKIVEMDASSGKVLNSGLPPVNRWPWPSPGRKENMGGQPFARRRGEQGLHCGGADPG